MKQQANRCNPAQTAQAVRREKAGKRPAFSELDLVVDAVFSVIALAAFILAAGSLFVMVGAGL